MFPSGKRRATRSSKQQRMIDVAASSDCVVLDVMHTHVLSPLAWLLFVLLVVLAPQQARASANNHVNEQATKRLLQHTHDEHQSQMCTSVRCDKQNGILSSKAGSGSGMVHGLGRGTVAGSLGSAWTTYGALASVLRLSCGVRGRQSPRPTLLFLDLLRDSWVTYRGSSGGSSSSSTNGGDMITTPARTTTQTGSSFLSGALVLLQSTAGALERGVAALGASGRTAVGCLRRRSAAGVSSPALAVVITLACVLAVAAANVVHIVPRPVATRGVRGSTGTALATVHPPGVLLPVSRDGEEACRGSLSLRERAGRWRGRRTRRTVRRLTERLLLKAPKFPLAYAPWWQALQERKKKRGALTVVEGLEAEDHEVTERAEGAQIFRSARFWGRSATIYLSYKKMQARCALELFRIKDEGKRELKRKEYWDGIHALNSDRMLKLCLDLRGFYLKSGQFLGTRHDFMPKIFLKKLGKLHDDVPPMPAEKVLRVLKRELDVSPDEMFLSLNLTHPVGSASISQVHSAVLRETGEKVAVKVQYPGAERVMMSDLRNLRTLAWFLQKFELNFDILSSLRELSKQIKGEFDFRAEAETMDRMHNSLGQHFARINVPESRLATKRVLVMSYLEGESLAQLKRGGKERFKAARKRIGKDLLHELADAWGYMIFAEGLFNADPHPGNILIIPEERVGPIRRVFSLLGLRTPKLRIGLLDWGQTKELCRLDREKVAGLILAVSNRHSEDIVTRFNSLGVKLSNPNDADSIEKLALVMFDTRTIKGLDFNPFSSNNVLKLNAVHEYPQDLYFILRTVLMFRGMAKSLGVEFSLADFWAPHASRLLASPPQSPYS